MQDNEQDAMRPHIYVSVCARTNYGGFGAPKAHGGMGCNRRLDEFLELREMYNQTVKAFIFVVTLVNRITV